MRRALLLGTLALAAIAWTPGLATAGGGCHEGATQNDATGQDETTVAMMNACFTASISTVDPGTRVTFVNEDWTTHNVGGNLWGFYGDMHGGDTFSATFDDPGVYPFACSYHPGMTGAIVVGDGFGAGDGWTVTSTLPVSEPEEPRTKPAAASGDSPAPWVVLAGLGGIVMGAAAVLGLTRTRKEPSTA